jgi:chromosome segregation ATPase
VSVIVTQQPNILVGALRSGSTTNNRVLSAASKKKKKSKKKANGASNGAAQVESKDATNNAETAEDEDEDEEEQNPTSDGSVKPSSATHEQKTVEASKPADEDAGVDAEDDDDDADDSDAGQTKGSETSARLDALQKERDNLRAEVSELRKSLEGLREKHNEELSGVKEELEQTQESKEQAESQYKTLLGKVNTIRSQLGERLKADAAELEQKREQIEQLESNSAAAQAEQDRLEASIAALNAKVESQSAELESIRSRTNLSSTNFAKERDELLSREAFVREEYEVAKQAMQDWEILATEERSRREALEERMQEVEEQLRTQQSAYERARNEVETQSSTVDGLQRALRDLQEERKKELRDLVEQSQERVDKLTAKLEEAESERNTLRTELDSTKEALERAEPFEKEVKEKNLLIGKLRHEAVILNDHLTKALRFLKRGRPEDNVDRHLVTNHFLHFLQLDRSDPKKFQVLQLIAALLAWDDAQRETAGLVRQGGSGFSILGGNPGASGGTGAGSTGSLRAPLSPFRRTPSTPTLVHEFPSDASGGAGKESLAELWSEFLDREAEAGNASGPASNPAHSRRPSLAMASSRKGRTPSLTGIFTPGTAEKDEMQVEKK